MSLTVLQAAFQSTAMTPSRYELHSMKGESRSKSLVAVELLIHPFHQSTVHVKLSCAVKTPRAKVRRKSMPGGPTLLARQQAPHYIIRNHKREELAQGQGEGRLERLEGVQGRSQRRPIAPLQAS